MRRPILLASFASAAFTLLASYSAVRLSHADDNGNGNGNGNGNAARVITADTDRTRQVFATVPAAPYAVAAIERGPFILTDVWAADMSAFYFLATGSTCPPVTSTLPPTVTITNASNYNHGLRLVITEGSLLCVYNSNIAFQYSGYRPY